MIGTKARDTLAESVADAHALNSTRPGVFRALLEHRTGVIGLVIVVTVALIALLAPILAPDEVVRMVAPMVVSSHEIQLPHGVGPPAQFTRVPERLTKSRVICRVFRSMTSVVVPPPAVSS